MLLGIDCTGSESVTEVQLRAFRRVLRYEPELKLVLFGDVPSFHKCMDGWSQRKRERVTLVHAPLSFEQDVSAMQLRHVTNQYGMVAALEYLRKGLVQGVVTSGATGAVAGLSTRMVGTLNGIDRPALAARIPLGKHSPLLLDIGAFATLPAERATQLGHLGMRWAMQSHQRRTASVGILNMGSELRKGTAAVAEYNSAVMQDTFLAPSYSGFIEPSNLFREEIDVLLCDGFTGNAIVKVIEGVTSAIYKRMLFSSASMGLWRGLPESATRRFRNLLTPDLHNGALMLGIRGLVVKSHSAAGQKALESAVYMAVRQREHGYDQFLSDWDEHHYSHLVKTDKRILHVRSATQ